MTRSPRALRSGRSHRGTALMALLAASALAVAGCSSSSGDGGTSPGTTPASSPGSGSSAAPAGSSGAGGASGSTGGDVSSSAPGGSSTASGGTSGSTGGGSTGEPVTVTVAVQPIADFSPIWLGLKQGFFTEQGITVQIVPGTASSSAQIPLLSSGQADLAATTATAALQAAAQKIPVTIVGGLTSFGASADQDASGLIVAKGSAIKGYADLVGKTVAVSGLKSVTQAGIMAAVAKAGADPNGVKFMQIPMPNIANTVTTGGADAGFTVDPFLGAAVAGGAVVVGRPLSEVASGQPATSLVASTPWAQAHGDVLTRFNTALQKAVDYCNAHPDDVIAATAEGAKIDPAKLKGSKNPVFDAQVDPTKLAAEAQMLHTYGALESEVDTGSLVWKG